MKKMGKLGMAVAGLSLAAVIGSAPIDRKAEAVYIENGEFQTQAAPWKASYFSEQMQKKRMPVHRTHAYRVFLEEGESIEKDVAPYVQNELRRTLHLNLDIDTVTEVIQKYTEAKKNSTSVEAEIKRAIEASGKKDCQAQAKTIREKISKGQYAWIACTDQFQTGHSLYLQDQINGQEKTLEDYKKEASNLMLQIQTNISGNKAAADLEFGDIYNQLGRLKCALEGMQQYVTHQEFDGQIKWITYALDALKAQDKVTDGDLQRLRNDFTRMSADYGARLEALESFKDDFYYPGEKFDINFVDPAPGDTSWLVEEGNDFEITPFPLAKGEIIKESQYPTALLKHRGGDRNTYMPDMCSAAIPGAVKKKIVEEWNREFKFNGEPPKIKEVVANIKSLGLIPLGFVFLGPGKNVSSLYGEGFKEPGIDGKITYKVSARLHDSEIHAGAGAGGTGGGCGGGGAGGGS